MPTPGARALVCAVLAFAVAAATGAARAQEGAPADPPGGPGAQVEEEETSEPLSARRERQRSCSTLARQIAHFEDVVERAEERDNDLWKRSTERHIVHLQALRERRGCPGTDDPNVRAQVAGALRKLGRLALTAASFGAL